MPAPRKRWQGPGDRAALTDDQAIGERDEAACSLVSRERSEDGESVVAGKNRRTQTWPALKDGARIVVGLADRSPDGQGVVQLTGEYSALVVVDRIRQVINDWVRLARPPDNACEPQRFIATSRGRNDHFIVAKNAALLLYMWMVGVWYGHSV